MSALQFGLTPKMKPLPQRRSVLVAALDIGTSKIACLIGRLRRRQPTEVLHHRTHAIDVIGFGHTLARGMKAGVDYKSFLMPAHSPDVQQSVIVEAAPVLFSKQALADNPALGKAVEALMGADFSNGLSKSVGVYNGNLKAGTPNVIVEADRSLVAAAKPRTLVRWWEAVPSQIQGDLVAKMGEFMFNPTSDNAEKVMNDMQAINADYWANK